MNKFFKLFIVLGMLLTSSLGYSRRIEHGCQSGIIVPDKIHFMRQDTAELKPTITPGPDYHYYLAEYDVQLDYSLNFEGTNCSLSFNRKNNSAFFSNNGLASSNTRLASFSLLAKQSFSAPCAILVSSKPFTD